MSCDLSGRANRQLVQNRDMQVTWQSRGALYLLCGSTAG